MSVTQDNINTGFNMKIGFAFLVYNKIYNEHVWSDLISLLEKDGHEIEMACHAKQPYTGKHPLDIDFIPTIYTKWGDKSLIEATYLLFAHLFEKGVDMVYLFSGDMIPLPLSRGFISFNEESTFCLQNKELLDGFYKRKQYDKSSGFTGINQNLWNRQHFINNGFNIPVEKFEKQAMFFCLTKAAFLEVSEKAIESNAFYKLQGMSPMDEFFWINLFIYYEIPFRPFSNYLFCHKRANIETQAQNFRMSFIDEEIKSKYCFLRKLRQEKVDIVFPE